MRSDATSFGFLPDLKTHVPLKSGTFTCGGEPNDDTSRARVRTTDPKSVFMPTSFDCLLTPQSTVWCTEANAVFSSTKFGTKRSFSPRSHQRCVTNQVMPGIRKKTPIPIVTRRGLIP